MAFFILSSPTWLPPGPPYSLSLSSFSSSLFVLSLSSSHAVLLPLSSFSLSLSGRWTGSPDQPSGPEKSNSRNPSEERSTKTTIRLKIDFQILDLGSRGEKGRDDDDDILWRRESVTARRSCGGEKGRSRRYPIRGGRSISFRKAIASLIWRPSTKSELIYLSLSIISFHYSFLSLNFLIFYRFFRLVIVRS